MAPVMRTVLAYAENLEKLYTRVEELEAQLADHISEMELK